MSEFAGKVVRQFSAGRFDFAQDYGDDFLPPGSFVNVLLPGDSPHSGDRVVATAIVEGASGDEYRHQQERHAYEYQCKQLGESSSERFMGERQSFVTPNDVEAELVKLFSPKKKGPEIAIGQLWGTRKPVPVILDSSKFLERHTCIFGSSGSGKTRLLFLLVEELLLSLGTAQIVVLDPNSDFAKFDQQDSSPPWSPEAEARREEAKKVVIPNLLAIPKKIIPSPQIHKERFTPDEQQELHNIDWATWSSASADALDPLLTLSNPSRFVQYNLGGLAFSRRAVIAEAVLKTLWQRNEKTRSPTFVVIDEAHNIAPAVAEEAWQRRTLDWVNRISGEGRKFGLFLILVSQRPAKIHSNAIDNCRNFMLMRLDNRDDIDALARRTVQVSESLLSTAATFTNQALIYGDLGHAAIIIPSDHRMQKNS